MSKNYLGRCAAVGIAGLTAMSSVAIVASAATQASIIYELKYGGIGTINMKVNGYTTGSNSYCHMDSSSCIDDGFVVKLDDFSSIQADVYTYTYNSTSKKVEKSSSSNTIFVWDSSDFKKSTGSDISISLENDGSKWTYNKIVAPSYTIPVPVKLTELYNDRGASSTTAGEIFAFKTASERDTAKNKIVSDIKSAYNKLASDANTQFRNDINEAASNARARLLNDKNDEITDATNTYNTSMASASNADDKADAQGTYNASIQTANEKYNTTLNLLNNAVTKLLNEFSQTFKADNFIYDDAAVFTSNNAPIKYSSTIGGLSLIAGAEFESGVGNTENILDGAKYWSGSNVYTNEDNYIFKGEIQPETVFSVTTSSTVPSFVFTNSTLSWVNFEVIENGSTTSGNTTVNGNTNTETKDDTTTTTTWYPSSSTYRNPSEVSYLGENGSWYTSASAATVYGGGYTGTSKSSDYASVNNNADGKAIYFNSATGSYSTTATSYSYVVKEATSSTNNSDDPYYSYFFNNGTSNKNNTTTVAAGSASIKGASKYAGWTNVAAYITNRAKSGATYSINMNDETIVPSTVLAAAKAKNVTLTFINDNGSKVTVKPGKVTSDLDVSVTYSVKDIKSSLVKKAKKVNSGTVSTAQVRIGEDGSIGGTATVNVKFSTKRAGCKVKAYRLSESGSLVKTATGTINSSGRVNLNLTKGGSYLLVVIDD